MAKTYHDAPITAAQMDKVLASLNSVSKASNNGKILYVDEYGNLGARELRSFIDGFGNVTIRAKQSGFYRQARNTVGNLMDVDISAKGVE